MVSGSLAGRSAFDVLRINAEFADQTSDHDPLMARLAISKGIVVDGGNGADQVVGGNGNDSLSGGNGADRVEAGDGKDVVTAGAAMTSCSVAAGRISSSASRAVICSRRRRHRPNDRRGWVGRVRVPRQLRQRHCTDFRSEDVITFDDVFTNFAAVRAASQQVGADTVITAQDGSSVTLKNVMLNSLQANDFALSNAAQTTGVPGVGTPSWKGPTAGTGQERLGITSSRRSQTASFAPK